MRSLALIFLAILILSSGCSNLELFETVPTVDSELIYTQAAATVHAQITQAFLMTPSATMTNTPEPTATMTVTPSPTPVPTEPWSYVPPGKVTAPILLYMHIADDKSDNPYTDHRSNLDIPSDVFREQMLAFKRAGYETISVSTLIQTIYSGGDLPPKPLVITFDGSTVGIYTKAFPIMKELEYTGTIYLLAGRLEGNGVISPEQAKEMVASGWEIGSKGYIGGFNLVNVPEMSGDEAGLSKSVLEDKLGVNVQTFAYPFGAMDEQLAIRVSRYGYLGAVGVGKTSDHSYNTVFYLSRLEITDETDLEQLNELLPWPLSIIDHSPVPSETLDASIEEESIAEETPQP